jgi:hypothetical protein
MMPSECELPEHLQEFVGIPALSIRQPWAWMILHARKDIENRPRRFKYRGPVLIHASLNSNAKLFGEALDFGMMCMDLGAAIDSCMQPDAFVRGGIVGVVDVVDCVDSSSSPWFMGPHGLVLRNPRSLPFTPCKGALSLFRWETKISPGTMV